MADCRDLTVSLLQHNRALSVLQNSFLVELKKRDEICLWWKKINCSLWDIRPRRHRPRLFVCKQRVNTGLVSKHPSLTSPYLTPCVTCLWQGGGRVLNGGISFINTSSFKIHIKVITEEFRRIGFSLPPLHGPGCLSRWVLPFPVSQLARLDCRCKAQ